jgi:hypothetical protein
VSVGWQKVRSSQRRQNGIQQVKQQQQQTQQTQPSEAEAEAEAERTEATHEVPKHSNIANVDGTTQVKRTQDNTT